MESRKPLFHFSEDPDIKLFIPHVAPSSSEKEPYVWALDEEHAPSYWFPRDCPRACCWATSSESLPAATPLFGLSGSRRMHAIEEAWLERIRYCRLFAYEFDPEPFQPKITDAGYWVTSEKVVPLSVSPVGDLLSRHAQARIELRIVKNLWPIIDAIIASGLEFSIIRKANAKPREPLSHSESISAAVSQ
jgi:hypothetical protein